MLWVWWGGFGYGGVGFWGWGIVMDFGWVVFGSDIVVLGLGVMGLGL